ncbi:MAG: ribonuclease H-like domain-containing protein [Chloroflexi bacterium]|nr:ribonuclease H-like domain-containing protein [Chloroflexota bacterium]
MSESPVTITLDRRLANFRAGRSRPAADTAGGPDPGSPSRRAVASGAERLAAEVDGELVHGPTGTFVRVERRSTVMEIDRDRLSRLPGQPAADVPLLCLDTETTGLATAAGTLAFLVGLGWWEGARFRQIQLLLPDHADEPAFLDELRRHVPGHGWLVTYNGRGFDWPLLVARYRMARADPPGHAGHLDLLPLVRRLFRHRMPDARLQTAEAHLLGLGRHDDVPGWEIPARYLQFLRDGDPALLLGVVRHNEEDVRSLARLLCHVDQHLAEPVGRRAAPAGDLAGLGRTFAAHHRFAEALDCLDWALEGLRRTDLEPVPGRAVDRLRPDDGGGGTARPEPRRVREDDDAWWSPRSRPDFGGRAHGRTSEHSWRTASGDRLDGPWTQERLEADRARLLRRLGRRVEAERAWLAVADRGGLVGALAWVEVAKIREHDRRDPEAALAATLAAVRFVERARFLGRPHPGLERDLVRRASRLRRRVARRQPARSGASAGVAQSARPPEPAGPAGGAVAVP